MRLQRIEQEATPEIARKKQYMIYQRQNDINAANIRHILGAEGNNK